MALSGSGKIFSYEDVEIIGKPQARSLVGCSCNACKHNQQTASMVFSKTIQILK